MSQFCQHHGWPYDSDGSSNQSEMDVITSWLIYLSLICRWPSEGAQWMALWSWACFRRCRRTRQSAHWWWMTSLIHYCLFQSRNPRGNAHIKVWLLPKRNSPHTWTCKWAGPPPGPHTWLRRATPLPTTCHGNYIPRDGIQLDQTLPKQFALALFTGIVRHGSTSFISRPCRKISGWTSLGTILWLRKEENRDLVVHKRKERGSVSVSLLIQVLGICSLVAWAYDEMSTILLLSLILFEQNNCSCLELALPNKFSLRRNNGTTCIW